MKVTSNKQGIATVAPSEEKPGSYVITAKKKGTAKITVQTFNKKKAVITVKVS